MKHVLLLLGAMLLSTLSLAEESSCRVDIQHDLRATSESMQVLTDARPVYEIGEGGYLRIDGDPVELSGAQRRLAEQYHGDIIALLRQWTELVSGAMNASETSLQRAFGDAFGADSAAVDKSGQVLERARGHLESVAFVEDGVYFLNASKFNRLDTDLDSEFEGDLDAVLVSLRAVLIELAKAMSSTEGSFAENMEAFGERMELMGTEMEELARSLHMVGDILCEQLNEVQKLEQKVAKSIPELASYPVFK